MPEDDLDIKIKLRIREHSDNLSLNQNQIKGVTDLVKTSQSSFQERMGGRIGELELDKRGKDLRIETIEKTIGETQKEVKSWIKGLCIALFAAVATTLGALYVQSKATNKQGTSQESTQGGQDH